MVFFWLGLPLQVIQKLCVAGDKHDSFREEFTVERILGFSCKAHQSMKENGPMTSNKREISLWFTVPNSCLRDNRRS